MPITIEAWNYDSINIRSDIDRGVFVSFNIGHFKE